MSVNVRPPPSTAPKRNQAQEAQGRQAGVEPIGNGLFEGARVGRFVIVHDVEGRTHALAAGAIGAICQTDEGSLLLLPGGRLVHVPRPMEIVLAWLDGRSA